jgi:hypothetical protein
MQSPNCMKRLMYIYLAKRQTKQGYELLRLLTVQPPLPQKNISPVFPFPRWSSPNDPRSLPPGFYPLSHPAKLYSHCTTQWSTLPWWCTGRQSAQQKGCYQTGLSHHWGQSSLCIHNPLGSPAHRMGVGGQIPREYLQTHLEGGE